MFKKCQRRKAAAPPIKTGGPPHRFSAGKAAHAVTHKERRRTRIGSPEIRASWMCKRSSAAQSTFCSAVVHTVGNAQRQCGKKRPGRTVSVPRRAATGCDTQAVENLVFRPTLRSGLWHQSGAWACPARAASQPYAQPKIIRRFFDASQQNCCAKAQCIEKRTINAPVTERKNFSCRWADTTSLRAWQAGRCSTLLRRSLPE